MPGTRMVVFAAFLFALAGACVETNEAIPDVQPDAGCFAGAGEFQREVERVSSNCEDSSYPRSPAPRGGAVYADSEPCGETTRAWVTDEQLRARVVYFERRVVTDGERFEEWTALVLQNNGESCVETYRVNYR